MPGMVSRSRRFCIEASRRTVHGCPRWLGLAADRDAVLLSYRKQFMVVNDAFIHEFDLDPADAAWADEQRNPVRAYGTGPWLTLYLRWLKALPSTFAAS